MPIRVSFPHDHDNILLLPHHLTGLAYSSPSAACLKEPRATGWSVCPLQMRLTGATVPIELHIYIEEVKRKGLGRGVGPELPAVSFSYEFLFFL
jgi:hypothetical protein